MLNDGESIRFAGEQDTGPETVMSPRFLTCDWWEMGNNWDGEDCGRNRIWEKNRCSVRGFLVVNWNSIHWIKIQEILIETWQSSAYKWYIKKREEIWAFQTASPRLLNSPASCWFWSSEGTCRKAEMRGKQSWELGRSLPPLAHAHVW